MGQLPNKLMEIKEKQMSGKKKKKETSPGKELTSLKSAEIEGTKQDGLLVWRNLQHYRVFSPVNRKEPDARGIYYSNPSCTDMTSYSSETHFRSPVVESWRGGCSLKDGGRKC